MHFGATGTACLDTATGKPLWKRTDLECGHHRGAGSSPVLVGDLVVLTFDGFDVQYLIALSKKTGDTVWKRDRKLPAKDDGPDFVSLARAARARKFGSELPKDWKERSRQARFLQYRGFSTDHIRAVLEGLPDELESDADPASESDPP